MLQKNVLFQVQELAYQSTEAVEKLLGAPAEIVSAPAESGALAGESRTYTVPLNSELLVEFSGGRAISFTLWFDLRGAANPPTPEAAVASAGIDVEGLTPGRSGPAGRWWKGRAGELSFCRIGATRSDMGSGWTCVQIQLEAPTADVSSKVGIAT